MANSLPHLERLFPALAASGYSKSSEYDPSYNCIAFSVHDTGQWWERLPVHGYYWPLDRDDRIEDWINALKLNNYTVTNSQELEQGMEKIAIYVGYDGSPTHVARQLASGSWTSKIGKLEDIVHSSTRALEGDEYGEVQIIMKRKRAKRNESAAGSEAPGDTASRRLSDALRTVLTDSLVIGLAAQLG